MRSSLKNIQQIENYILDTMDASEKTLFEAEIAESMELTELLHFQKLLQHASRRMALRAEIISCSLPPRKSIWQKFKSLFVGGVILASILGTISWFGAETIVLQYPNYTSEKGIIDLPDNTRSYNHNPSVNSSNQPVSYSRLTSTVYDTPSSFSKDSGNVEHNVWTPMHVQHFIFDASKGGVFEGEDGTLIVVPKNSIQTLDGKRAKGKVEMQLVEALTVEDMIGYNLQTVSGKDVLSSGGMIRTQFVQDGERVLVDPQRPLSIEIPTTNYNPEMKVWEGVEKGGTIDWKNPKNLSTYLTIVDFDRLDFLPDGFSETVEAIVPYHGHTVASDELIDSLYYSLTTRESERKRAAPKMIHTDELFVQSYGHARSVKPGSRGGSKLIFLQKIRIAVYEKDSLYCWVQTNNAGSFEIDLRGKNERTLILDPEIENSNPRPQEVTFRKGEISTFVFETWMTEEELDQKSELFGKRNNSSNGGTRKYCFINPISIKSLLTEEFQNTFIATKEFEERLKIIHSLEFGDEILEIYLENLNKPLWKCDQLASKALSGEMKKVFEKFEKQGLTNVDNDGINQAELTNYYNQKRKEFEAKRLQEKHRYQDLDHNQLTSLENDLVKRLNNPNEQVSNNRNEIRVANMKWSVLKSQDVSRRSSYKTTWYSASWMNIDCYLTRLSATSIEVDITVEEEGKDLTVYQYLPSAKTLVTLTNNGGVYQAKFPETKDYENAYCIAISRNGDDFYYDDFEYSKGMGTIVEFKLKNVLAEEMKTRLMLLTPFSSKIITGLEVEKRMLEKEKRRRILTKDIDDKINAIIQREEKEREIRELLRRAISKCEEVAL